MARRTPAKVVMNREAVDAIRLGYADGLQEEAEAIIAAAAQRINDAEPTGRGLKFSGMATTYVEGKRVAGSGTPPRGQVPKAGTVTILGFGWPGWWYETGTIKQAPRPVLTPAMAAAVSGGMAAVPRRIIRRLAGVRR
jgi:hypothetical protein